MNTYRPTIGLEIHAELKTRTKMFCDSLNDPDEKHPNVNVCPVCLGHPGTLPTINKQAVELVIKTGLALNGKINPITKFDRKNYFYPDLPKGYQISQFDQPLVLGGELTGVHLTRIHLEEDAGKLAHTADGKSSLVDFNRAGVPLMELVTEPEMKGVEDTVRFAKEFQLLLRYIGASDADLERGQMRFDLNISVARSNDARMESNENRIEKNTDQIVLKDESYQLMGLLFEIHNKLGPVYKEKNYQDAIEEVLKREGMSYEREKRFKLKLDGLEVSDFLVDFVVDGKILLEVKAAKSISQEDIRQVLRYIQASHLPLGIIANFRGDTLDYKRLINAKFDEDSIPFEKNSGAALGTKVEIKNLNSFRALEEAIEYETKRQSELLDRGERIAQETRGWDDVKKKTVSQRSKEDAHDYRYFPEPDLPPIEPAKIWDIKKMRDELPELPEAKKKRFRKELDDLQLVEITDARIATLITNKKTTEYFEAMISEIRELCSQSDPRPMDTQYRTFAEFPKFLRNVVSRGYKYLTENLPNHAQSEGVTVEAIYENFGPGKLASFVYYIEFGLPGFHENDIQGIEGVKKIFEMLLGAGFSDVQIRGIFTRMLSTREELEDILQSGEFKVISNTDELEETIKQVMDENPTAVADYVGGKTASMQFLIGKAMGKLRGRGKPDTLKDLFLKNLSR